MSSQKIMSNDIVMFSECSKSQRVELAKEVLVGNRTISVLVTDKNGPMFAVDQRWGNKLYKPDPWVPFESGMCRIYSPKDKRKNIAVPIPAESDDPLLFYSKLYKQEIISWLREQGCQVFPGFWEIAKPRKIAAEILEDVRLKPGHLNLDSINFNKQQRKLVWIKLIKGENDKHYCELRPWEKPRVFTPNDDSVNPGEGETTFLARKFLGDMAAKNSFGTKAELIRWLTDVEKADFAETGHVIWHNSAGENFKTQFNTVYKRVSSLRNATKKT